MNMSQISLMFVYKYQEINQKNITFAAFFLWRKLIPECCRHDVPAISARNLYDLSIAEYTFSKQSLMRIDVKYRDHFLVDYRYGFNSSTHVYFVTVQKKSYLPGKIFFFRGNPTPRPLPLTCVVIFSKNIKIWYY